MAARQVNNIKISLVIDTNDSYSDLGVNVIDLDRIQPVGPNLYIIHTSPFQDDCIKNGAGNYLSEDQKKLILSSPYLH